MSMPQFYDEEKKMFLNGRQVTGKCPIPGCTSEKAYADECSLGHQFLPSELINPISCLSNKKPVLKDVENWYFDLEYCIHTVKDYNDFLRKNTNTRKYQLETVEEFLKKPLIYVPRKYIGDLEELAAKLPPHKLTDEEKKPSVVFEFENLDDRDKAKTVLEASSIHYTSGKTLVPFRLSGNVEWGVPFPACEELKDLTFWVWPESLWAPISFTLAYLKKQGSEDGLSRWWYDEESKVYQFIGEDNIYFYAIAQTGLFTGLQVPKGEVPDMESVYLSHIIANRHLLYMDTKASSSSELKPPAADELLRYYTKDQLRMHFMSLGLSSKSAGFKPQVFMKEEDRIGVDMVLKDGDIVSVDCGTYMNGFCGDSAYTFCVGEVDEEIRNLLKVTKEALYIGIQNAVHGKRIGDIGYAIQQYCESHSYGVVREFVGHGIGKEMHEDPQVPNYGKRGYGPLMKRGLCIAIEPMITLGDRQVIMEGDGWTVRTRDRKCAAHFEHTVAVGAGEADILSSFKFIEEVLGDKAI